VVVADLVERIAVALEQADVAPVDAQELKVRDLAGVGRWRGSAIASDAAARHGTLV